VSGLDGFNEHFAHWGLRVIYARERRKGDRKIHRGYFLMILAGQKGRAVAGQRHVTVVGGLGLE
jgi:hypothetical protein